MSSGKELAREYLLKEISFARTCFQEMQNLKYRRQHLEEQRARHEKMVAGLTSQNDSRLLVKFIVYVVSAVLIWYIFGNSWFVLFLATVLILIGVFKKLIPFFFAMQDSKKNVQKVNEQQNVIKLYSDQISLVLESEQKLRNEVSKKSDFPIGYIYPEALREFESYALNFKAYTVNECISIYNNEQERKIEASAAENRRIEEQREREINQKFRDSVNRQLKDSNDNLRRQLDEVKRLNDRIQQLEHSRSK